jgi:ankyrin repeat protein
VCVQSGYTALMLAAHMGHEAVEELLLQSTVCSGADIHATNEVSGLWCG